SRQQKAIIRLAARAATIIEDLPSALRFITKIAGDALESEHVCVWMFSESRKQLKCANHFEKSSNTHSEGYSFDIDKAASYISAIESERAVAAEDAQNDPLTAELNEVFLKPRGIISLLSAPIRIAGKLRGVATFAHSSRKKTWFADEISFSTEVADQLAQAFIEDERTKKEAELKKLSMVIEHSVNVVFITDSAGVIEYTNPVFETVTGYASEEAIGKNASILASDEVSKDEYRDMWQLLKDGNTWHGIFKNKKKDGSYYWSNTVITPIKDDFGAVTKFLSVLEDITEKRVSEEKIHMLEDYDTVTGLFNREHFMKEMNNCLSETQILGLHGVLMVIDLDRFQYLNDTYGHAYGDQTLKRVAGVIDDAVNEISAKLSLKIKGFTGRLCSDEFAVFLPGAGTGAALASAEDIRSKIASFSSAQHNEHLTASIGIALMPEHGIVTSELFTKADAATFRAKELGRNRTKLFNAEDKDLENMHIRLNQKERILKALEEDRFIPWFQPILDIKKNIVSHYEALARMRSEDGAILLPGAFIDTAERFGLVDAIDKIIINKTMLRQAALASEGKLYTFSVNLSGKDLGDAEFLEFLKEHALKSGVQADYLIFEITETAAIRDFDKAVKFIRELKALGFKFSLDDFGVGFTSFRYLKDMGVDYIKIDGAFIKKLDDDETDMLFVKAIAGVAAGMGIKTVAEFVERETVLAMLAEFGIDYAQGYFIGKPAPDVL
ncbi:bifunctional diguanylate cyclase/phosphodiesterase, partial [bacterium]